MGHRPLAPKVKKLLVKRLLCDLPTLWQIAYVQSITVDYFGLYKLYKKMVSGLKLCTRTQTTNHWIIVRLQQQQFKTLPFLRPTHRRYAATILSSLTGWTIQTFLLPLRITNCFKFHAILCTIRRGIKQKSYTFALLHPLAEAKWQL